MLTMLPSWRNALSTAAEDVLRKLLKYRVGCCFWDLPNIFLQPNHVSSKYEYRCLNVITTSNLLLVFFTDGWTSGDAAYDVTLAESPAGAYRSSKKKKKANTAICTVFKDFNASLNLRVWEPQRENLTYSASISVFTQITYFLTFKDSSSIRYLRYIDADQVSNLHNSSSFYVGPTTAYGGAT